MRDLKLLFLPCLVLLAVTVPHLEQGDFRRDTGRYAAVGLYMWSGGSPLAPYLNPETPYFNKPPLAMAIHGFFLKLFGVHLAVARAPSILAALGVVALTVLSARRIGSRAEAVVSGLVLALTYDFFRRTREISLDTWQLLFVMLAVYCAVVALRRQSQIHWVWAGIPLGLALLCKPVNALAVIPVFGLWAVLVRQYRALPALLLGTLPVAVAVAAPWHAYMVATFDGAFIRQYLFHEVVDRARGLRSTNPFYFYLTEHGLNYWPWMAGLVYAAYYRLAKTSQPRARRRDLVLMGGAWALFVGIGLSLFPDKKVNYALPLFPMLSWIVAAGLCRLPWQRLRSWYARGFRGVAPAAVVILIVCSLLPIQFQKPPSKEWRALLGWLQENQVEPSRIFYGTVQYNDLCYFYLKTGHWMRRADAGEAGGTAAAPATFVLTRPAHSAPAVSPASIRFAAGELALVPASMRIRAELLP
jgi:4-amino-4-deoxy-L-arabinose transferase-like glycosyltransferase